MQPSSSSSTSSSSSLSSSTSSSTARIPTKFLARKSLHGKDVNAPSKKRAAEDDLANNPLMKMKAAVPTKMPYSNKVKLYFCVYDVCILLIYCML